MSDTHLGWRSLHRVNVDGRNQRECDVYDAFARAIDKTIDLMPDLVIHSGDLFDGYHPSSAALKVCLDGIRRLVRRWHTVYRHRWQPLHAAGGRRRACVFGVGAV